jgi:hypothetical protein
MIYIRNLIWNLSNYSTCFSSGIPVFVARFCFICSLKVKMSTSQRKTVVRQQENSWVLYSVMLLDFSLFIICFICSNILSCISNVTMHYAASGCPSSAMNYCLRNDVLFFKNAIVTSYLVKLMDAPVTLRVWEIHAPCSVRTVDEDSCAR